ncbi:MAG TPA: cytochrome c [Oxalicibacterium sp.]|nr:cytochrome c [Oxalicibacterium sp.]
MKKLFALAAVSLLAVSFGASAADVEAGKAAVAKFNCASCHGADFNSPIDPAYPKLAGQHQDYLVHALTAYRRGTGSNSRSNPIMGPLAKQLSDADIQNIAAYLHSLPGSLVVRK